MNYRFLLGGAKIGTDEQIVPPHHIKDVKPQQKLLLDDRMFGRRSIPGAYRIINRDMIGHKTKEKS